MADFDSPVDAVPELGVLEIKRAYVAGLEGWLVSPEGQLLPDHAWYGANTSTMEKRLRQTREPLRIVRLKGSALSLGTRGAGTNYGHFLLDSVGRLALLEPAGLQISQFDHVIGDFPNASGRRMLERAGVPLDRFVRVAKGIAIQPEIVFAPTFPGTRRNYLPWLVEFLRGTLPATPTGATRRLYIQRKVDRRVLNEAQLLPVLEQYGFELYDPGEHADPAADFASASVVVGPHGAGLADLAFCQPGTSVLELIPEDHAMPYWYTLSEAGGLRYGYLIGDAHPAPRGDVKSDVTIDVDEFRTALADTVRAERKGNQDDPQSSRRA